MQVSLVLQPVIQAAVPVTPAALLEGATVTELAIVSVIVVQIFSRHVQVLQAISYAHMVD